MSSDLPEHTGGYHLQCPCCKEIIPGDYLDQFPFPEFPCPCCGSLVKRTSEGRDEPSLPNHRKDERFSVALKVTYPNLKRFIIDYTKNVSRGGMFIKTNTAYDPGTHIALSLHVPGLAQPLQIVGRVVHNRFGATGSEDTGVGVEFIQIEESSRDMLVDYAKNRKGTS